MDLCMYVYCTELNVSLLLLKGSDISIITCFQSWIMVSFTVYPLIAERLDSLPLMCQTNVYVESSDNIFIKIHMWKLFFKLKKINKLSYSFK